MTGDAPVTEMLYREGLASSGNAARIYQKAYDPTAIEDRWAAYWVSERCSTCPLPKTPPLRLPFTMLLPPPNVTGNLHMGHMFEHTETDILVRWQRMLGDMALGSRARTMPESPPR